MRNFLKPLAIAAISAVTVVAAHAGPLVYVNLGASPIANYGTLVAGTQNTYSVGPPATGFEPFPYVATYTEGVYTGGTGSLCTGCLAFVFTFTNSASTGSDGIELFTDTVFNNFDVTTEYITNGGIAPTSVADNGGTVNFAFNNLTGNSVKPGQTSDTLVIFTNATNYQIGGVGFADGQTSNGPGLMPAAASVTPEPNSLLLLGTGIVGIAGAVRRKFKKA